MKPTSSERIRFSTIQVRFAKSAIDLREPAEHKRNWRRKRPLGHVATTWGSLKACRCFGVQCFSSQERILQVQVEKVGWPADAVPAFL